MSDWTDRLIHRLTTERDAALEAADLQLKAVEALCTQLDTALAERDAARATLQDVRAWTHGFVGYAATHLAVAGAYERLVQILNASRPA